MAYRDGGGTAMSLGMNVGLTKIARYAAPNLVNRMVLLTDGVTYGDADRCRRIADDAGAAGVGIYPLGIGADWDEDLLDNIGSAAADARRVHPPARRRAQPLRAAAPERRGGHRAQHADDATPRRRRHAEARGQGAAASSLN